MKLQGRKAHRTKTQLYGIWSPAGNPWADGTCPVGPAQGLDTPSNTGL